jgi:hypothetical protein
MKHLRQASLQNKKISVSESSCADTLRVPTTVYSRHPQLEYVRMRMELLQGLYHPPVADPRGMFKVCGASNISVEPLSAALPARQETPI